MLVSEWEAEDVALTDGRASLVPPGREPGSLTLRGESHGKVRGLCGRVYSRSIEGSTINLINGLISASKHSSEIRSREEEVGWR